jgi:hypothetical protein
MAGAKESAAEDSAVGGLGDIGRHSTCTLWPPNASHCLEYPQTRISRVAGWTSVM